MSSAETNNDTQVRNLVELVNNRRDAECDKIRARADQQAKDIFHTAHRNARRRFREDVSQRKLHFEQQLVSFEAKQRTSQRLKKQRSDQRFLQLAWTHLKEAVESRWGNAATRRSWVESVFEQASSRLPHECWHVEHANGWPTDEQQQFIDKVKALTENAPTLQETGEITAGIRISVQGAQLDGSLEGLLTNRTRIETEMLALYLQTQAEQRKAENE